MPRLRIRNASSRCIEEENSRLETFAGAASNLLFVQCCQHCRKNVKNKSQESAKHLDADGAVY